MAEQRIPRRAQQRMAAQGPPSRSEEFDAGRGQLPRPGRLDSRDLQPGDRVRLHLGVEGSRSTPGYHEGTVLKQIPAGVRINSTKTVRPFVTDKGIHFGGNPAGIGVAVLAHDTITRVEHL